MKSNQLSTHNLLSQSGATSLNATSPMDLGHGVSFTLGGSLSVSDHSATSFTIEERLEDQWGCYLTIEECAGCQQSFPELAPIDAGHHYHAFLLPTCPTCTKAIGGPLLDDPTEEEQQLILEAHNWFQTSKANHFNQDIDEDWDSDREKWSNYWGDYNQCGVRVNY
jgi:hypothetical protein